MRSRPGAAGGLREGLRQRTRGRLYAVLPAAPRSAGAGGKRPGAAPGLGQRRKRRVGASERPGGTGCGGRRRRRCKAPPVPGNFSTPDPRYRNASRQAPNGFRFPCLCCAHPRWQQDGVWPWPWPWPAGVPAPRVLAGRGARLTAWVRGVIFKNKLP